MDQRFDSGLAALASAVLAYSREAIISRGLDGLITGWNPAAEKMFGLPPEDALDHAIDMLVPADRRVEQGLVDDALRRGVPVDAFDTVRMRHGGEAVFVALSAAPLFDHAGNRLGDVIVLRDIRNRKQLEARLQYFVSVINSSNDAITTRDLNGLITSWNPAAERLYGYSATEAIGQPLSILAPPNDPHGVELALERIKHGERVEHFETTRVRKGGRLVSISLSASPISNEFGELVGVCGIARDIGPRRQMEARLRLYESVINSSDDSIITRDVEGRITSWNPASERMYGYRAAEAVGQPLSMLVPPDQPEELELIMARLRRGERVEHFETLRVRKDGTHIAVSLSISPVHDEFGNLVGACAIARDISEARLRQQQMERWALQDSLTGLPNRRALLDRLAVVLEKTRRSGMQAGLLFIDLDDFKRVNDLGGHAGGDAVLIEVARRAHTVLRAADTVARMGGDEFVVLLDDLGFDRVAALAHAKAVGQKLLEALRAVQVGGLTCSASIGLTVFSDGEHTVDEMLSRADHAMYEAKKLGKNQLCVIADDAPLELSRARDEPRPPAPPRDPD